MSKTSLIFLLLTTISLIVAQPPPPIQQIFETTSCDNDPSFDNHFAGSALHDTNLKTLIATLQHQSESIKFSATTSGAHPNTVYGQYYCRGDISTALCGACVNEAVNGRNGFTICPKNVTIGATVIQSECTVRYSNESMYGVLDVAGKPQIGPYRGNVTTAPQQFSAELTTIMTVLIEEAVNDRSRFATTTKGNETTLYGLVQCSPDLNGTQCGTCLRSIYDELVSTFNNGLPDSKWPTTLYAMYPSCQVMYSTEGVFYYDPPLAPPALVSSPPSPSPESTPSPVSPPSFSTVSQSPSPSLTNRGSAAVGRSESNKKGIVISAAFVILLIFI